MGNEEQEVMQSNQGNWGQISVSTVTDRWEGILGRRESKYQCP